MPDGNGGNAAIFPWHDALSRRQVVSPSLAFLAGRPSPQTTETFLQQNLKIETAT
jgi:hypothetical protein